MIGKTVLGEVIAHGSEFRQVRVRLEGGREVEAVIPTTRKFGCLFGSLVGWSVRVALREAPKKARVVQLESRV